MFNFRRKRCVWRRRIVAQSVGLRFTLFCVPYTIRSLYIGQWIRTYIRKAGYRLRMAPCGPAVLWEVLPGALCTGTSVWEMVLSPACGGANICWRPVRWCRSHVHGGRLTDGRLLIDRSPPEPSGQRASPASHPQPPRWSSNIAS